MLLVVKGRGKNYQDSSSKTVHFARNVQTGCGYYLDSSWYITSVNACFKDVTCKKCLKSLNISQEGFNMYAEVINSKPVPVSWKNLL